MTATTRRALFATLAGAAFAPVAAALPRPEPTKEDIRHLFGALGEAKPAPFVRGEAISKEQLVQNAVAESLVAIRKELPSILHDIHLRYS